jgi:oligoribonuclease NrnB/cAMP/cGMP phosphodiesterase (DHH superfamily)
MKIYVLSHTDPDGYFSGALVEYFYKLQDPNIEVIHKSWTYGRNEPSIKNFSKKYDKVYIVDVLPSNDFMDALIEEMGVSNVILCDHHVKKDEDYLNTRKDLNVLGIRNKEKDAAVIAVWKYFNVDEPVPKWIKLISDYDTWNTSVDYWNDEVIPYSFYIRNNINSVKDAYNYILSICDSLVIYKNHIRIGKTIQTWWDDLYKKEVAHGFEKCLKCKNIKTNEEHIIKVWVVNTQNRGSYMFNHLSTGNIYDAFITYNFNGTLYKYSMYTFKDDIPCNNLYIILNDNIYIEFNGHPDAAGASSEYNMFNYE